MNQQEIIQTENRVMAHTFNRFPITFTRGDKTTLWDADEKSYLDFFSGHAVMNLGYNYPEQMKAMQQQLKQLVHTGNLYYLEAQVSLAQLITENSFGEQVLFSNSGAEIVDLAIKLARKWARQQDNKDDRFEVLTVRGSFHGRTYGALSASGQDKLHQGIEPMLPGFKYVLRNDFTSVAAAITNKTCAIMIEPIQGEGGIYPTDTTYLKKLRELCERNELLLIFDEIQCGLGRTGSLHAYEHYQVQPDIMLLGKPLGGGLPLSALVTTKKIATALTLGDHGSTFGGNPVAASGGCVLYRQLLKPKFMEHVKCSGQYLGEKLHQIAENYPGLVKETRGQGLMWGMEVTAHGPAIVQKALELGLVINCTAGCVLRFLPALIITPEDIDQMGKLLDKAIKSVLAGSA